VKSASLKGNMEKPIRVGIIGLGRSGWKLHGVGLSKLSNYKIAAVADPEAARREEAVAEFGCVAYATPAELMADSNVELVVIATPSHTHGPLSIAALEAGKHVVVEKPMATSVLEADEMIAAAERTGKTLNAFQVRRNAADFLKIREIIESGVLGPIHLIKMNVYNYARRTDWQTLRKFGGGELNNTGAHYIDQALILAGGGWTDLLADVRLVASAGDADDHIKIVFRGCNKAMVDIEISGAAAAPARPPHWTVLGKYGALTGTMKHFDWKYYDPQKVPAPVASEATPGRVKSTPEVLPWVEKSEEIIGSPGLPLFYDALYRALREGEKHPALAEEVRKLTALLDACRSHNEN
jgi:predicted dehydrogenase